MHEVSGSPTLIRLIDLCKHYVDGDVHALKHVNLSIDSGQTMAIVGPSGCGKSTLLNMIGALDIPTSGQVIFKGMSLENVDLNRFRSQEIGFVFQSFYLLPNLTALENVQLPMLEGSLGTSQRVQRARELLSLVGLEQRQHHLPNQLSNGQRQRVAIARALANQPSLILADEPTGSLDSQSGLEVMELLFELNSQQRKTLIVVTHDTELAKRVDRTIRMRDGQVDSERSI